MNHNREILAVCSSLLAVTVLAACGAADGDRSQTARGRLDDTKHVKGSKAVTRPATRTVPTFTNQCKTKTSKVGKTTSTRTECNKVRTGSRVETYTKTIKPAKSAKWCVELDRVNGKNDVWFRVSKDVFDRWHGQREGKKVRRLPYIAKGC